MNDVVRNVPRDLLAALCQRWHIRQFSVFGSALRDDFSSTSDVDVLVEFESGKAPGLLGMERLREELSLLFCGRPVDICTVRSLHPKLREPVQRAAIVQYATAA